MYFKLEKECNYLEENLSRIWVTISLKKSHAHIFTVSKLQKLYFPAFPGEHF